MVTNENKLQPKQKNTLFLPDDMFTKTWIAQNSERLCKFIDIIRNIDWERYKMNNKINAILCTFLTLFNYS
jgi:hypothetical protein